MGRAVIHTPIGFFELIEDKGYLTNVSFLDKQSEEITPTTPILIETKKQLLEYFAGSLKAFTLPIYITGSPYKIAVLKELSKVEFGKIVTYGELAQRVDSPKSARAVGSAMRTNPIAIIIPCHRVLPQSKKVGNYSAGGSANKEWLLVHEHQNL